MYIIDYVVCPQQQAILNTTVEKIFSKRKNYRPGISGLCAGLSIGLFGYILDKNIEINSFPEIPDLAFSYIKSLFGITREMTLNEVGEHLKKDIRGVDYRLVEGVIETLHGKQHNFEIKLSKNNIKSGCYLLPIKITHEDGNLSGHEAAVWIAPQKINSARFFIVYEPNYGLYLVSYGSEAPIPRKEEGQVLRINNELSSEFPENIADAISIFYSSYFKTLNRPSGKTYTIEDEWYFICRKQVQKEYRDAIKHHQKGILAQMKTYLW
ncbi:hypothetical protein [Lelliottia wanjuensis]|uniref:hypothetical protein n=1 Tax=Lelliottia wanjuensis TaxID=3050585 RepID=UPI00254B73F5|nr:hypothetical protein [Lelliottia sp. V104_15]MDK9605833.1 hypothetical protein [Lelliottia sp. V104_15]